MQIIKQRAEGRWQRAEGIVSRRFKPLLTEDHQASLSGGIKPQREKEEVSRQTLCPLPSAICLQERSDVNSATVIDYGNKALSLISQISQPAILALPDWLEQTSDRPQKPKLMIMFLD